ncbi:hypothetical protein Acr_00g0078090 [Actinidia rufa]|uniref:Uncharacterized protein n=1 Tax=Actinidia rufa TaxID=165716 RepID=A0A7J0DTF6_9ERIC|nr:hypothetical protein Acr_00g0078090 [Actinidia rufa]
MPFTKVQAKSLAMAELDFSKLSFTNCEGKFTMKKSKVDTHGEPFPFALRNYAPRYAIAFRNCTQIIAVSRTHDVQASLCRMSSVGIPVNFCVLPELRRNCRRGCHVARARMFGLRIPNFLFAVLSIPNVRGAARLLRPRLVLIGTGLELNRAQLLVHDDEALAQFCIDHRISDDVMIKQPGPNDDSDWVEGEGNRIPIRTWFIHQAGLRFPLGKLLRTVLSLCGLTFMQVSGNFVQTLLAVEALMQRELEFTAEDLLHVYCVVKPRKNPETQMLEGFNGHFWRRSDRCSAAISAVNNYRRSHKVFDLLGYVPLYRYTIPLRATRQGRPILSPLQVCGQAPRPRSSLSDEVSDLFEGTSAELRGLLEKAKSESSDFSESSSSSWDVDLGDEGLDEEAEVEDGKEVDQVPAAAPLLREVVKHSYSCNGSSSSSSQGNEETVAPKVSILGKGQAPRIKPARLPKVPNSSVPVSDEDQSIAPSSMDHETCVALGNAVMLPQDVADHAAETTTEFWGKLANNLEKELKQAKSKFTDTRSVAEIATLQWNQAQQEASDLKAFACGKVYKRLFDRAFERAGDVYERQLAELRPDIFQEGWLAFQLLASPERYSPIILPNFNEEEYATLPADEGNVNIVVAEACAGIEETVNRDRAREAEGPYPGFGEHIPTSFEQSLLRAIVCSQQMSLSSSPPWLLPLEVLCKFQGIKMIVLLKTHILDLDRCSTRAGGLVELASPSPSAFTKYQSLMGTLPYLEVTIHKAAALLAILDDRSVVPLSFRMEG